VERALQRKIIIGPLETMVAAVVSPPTVSAKAGSRQTHRVALHFGGFGTGLAKRSSPG